MSPDQLDVTVDSGDFFSFRRECLTLKINEKFLNLRKNNKYLFLCFFYFPKTVMIQILIMHLA